MVWSLKKIAKIWDFLLALTVGAAAALWLDPTALKEVATEIIAFFGFQSAVILPAMIFTASVLRAEGLSLSEVQRYQAALRRQMHFWVSLLVLDFLAVCVLIVGKASEWKHILTFPYLAKTIDTGTALLTLTAFLGTLAVLRLIPFVKGVISLLELNGELTQKAIRARDTRRIEDESREAPGVPFKTPEGFGRITKPH
jgi:hypothetical protein